MLFEGTMLWLVAVTALALWIPQNAAHEYAHVVAHRHWGDTVTKFVVYPTNADDKLSLAFWRSGFTWAYMSYKRGGDGVPDDAVLGIQSIAPQLTNTVICSVLLALRWRFPEMNEIVASLLTAWFITNFVDGAVNLGTYYKWWVPNGEGQSSDGWKFQHRWHLPVPLCRASAVVWHVWFGFYLLIPGSWL